MPALEPGYRLDRYELLCKIGQGGMATVWLARTTNSHGDEKLVAVKTILPGAGGNELKTMLLDEARIAKSIDHPNVACTLEVGQLWDMPYLVLEYVEGDPVDQLCKTLSEEGLGIPPSIVTRIVADAAAGLHAAHEVFGPDGENLGIVHRDVSPPNILVDDLGQSRVIDFGVAKATERFSPETQTGVMKGRVPYMSPEHASGGQVDRRADIWSLGVVAYFMLTGKYPFDGANDAARLIQILGTEPAAPLPENIPEALRMVVMKALTKDVDQRWQTADELRAALKSAVKPATHEEVVKFCAETLTVPQRARRALVDHALAAAAQRARARELLDGPYLQTPSRSVRPPVVALDDIQTSSAGTLNRPVTVTKSQRPIVRTWGPWMVGGAIAGIVILAFAMGTMSATNASGNRPIASQEPTPKAGGGDSIPSGRPAAAVHTATTPTSTPSSAPTTTAGAGTGSAASTASSKPTATAPSIYTWPPPKPPASASASSKTPTKPPPTKPPEKEDTIF